MSFSTRSFHPIRGRPLPISPATSNSNTLLIPTPSSLLITSLLKTAQLNDRLKLHTLTMRERAYTTCRIAEKGLEFQQVMHTLTAANPYNTRETSERLR
jgi:hypothetical protein